MSQRREIEARLSLYSELTGLLGAMKSFALTELHRVARREEAQQAVLATVDAALRDLAPALPEAPPAGPDLWVLIGSARGFCASYNEDVRAAWQSEAESAACIVVGERLAELLPEGAALDTVPGALGALDASAAADRLLAVLATRRGAAQGLVVCLRDEEGPRSERLLPLPRPAGKSPAFLPLTHGLPGPVAAEVAERYLLHQLLALQLRAIRVENRMRLMQMESALRHLEEGGEELGRVRNRLRQEEIVEEIELMAGRGLARPFGS